MVEKAVSMPRQPPPQNSATDAGQYIIRSGNKKPRLKSKLYLFNSFGMIGRPGNFLPRLSGLTDNLSGAYCMVVVPNFVMFASLLRLSPNSSC
jgi:hypothetical protein